MLCKTLENLAHVLPLPELELAGLVMSAKNEHGFLSLFLTVAAIFATEENHSLTMVDLSRPLLVEMHGGTWGAWCLETELWVTVWGNRERVERISACRLPEICQKYPLF